LEPVLKLPSATTGCELQRAHTLAKQLGCPALVYPIAFDLGRWFETAGREQEAATLDGTAKAAIERMAAAVDDEGLRAIFLNTVQVQAGYGAANRK
jgi:hypothetical protein